MLQDSTIVPSDGPYASDGTYRRSQYGKESQAISPTVCIELDDDSAEDIGVPIPTSVSGSAAGVGATATAKASGSGKVHQILGVPTPDRNHAFHQPPAQMSIATWVSSNPERRSHKIARDGNSAKRLRETLGDANSFGPRVNAESSKSNWTDRRSSTRG